MDTVYAELDGLDGFDGPPRRAWHKKKSHEVICMGPILEPAPKFDPNPGAWNLEPAPRIVPGLPQNPLTGRLSSQSVVANP